MDFDTWSWLLLAWYQPTNRPTDIARYPFRAMNIWKEHDNWNTYCRTCKKTLPRKGIQRLYIQEKEKEKEKQPVALSILSQTPIIEETRPSPTLLLYSSTPTHPTLRCTYTYLDAIQKLKRCYKCGLESLWHPLYRNSRGRSGPIKRQRRLSLAQKTPKSSLTTLRSPNLKPQTFDLEPETLNLQPWTSNLEPKT